MLLDNVLSAFGSLRSNRLRSALTALGIAIAVASTISVVSVVRGLTSYVEGFLRGFGTNAIWIWPERPEGDAGRSLGAVELDEADAEAIARGCPALGRVSPLVRRPMVRLRGAKGEVSSTLEGVAHDYTEIRRYAVDVGRPFSVVDDEQAGRVCLLGRDVLKKLGLDEGAVGKPVIVDGQRFRIVGVLGEKGSFFGLSQDDIVLIPHSTALRMYPEMRLTLALAAQATTESAVPEARAQVINLLRRRHDLAPHQPNDFQVRTQDEVLAIFNQMSVAATLVLSAIVGVSLLVGGIGVMNVMLVSVSERTREIGLRKAVGARRRDLLIQFLTEAVALSLLGGALGIALGYGLGALVSLHPQMVSVEVPFWAVVLGVGGSAGSGVVFGMLPAIKAALLNPIDALRHE